MAHMISLSGHQRDLECVCVHSARCTHTVRVHLDLTAGGGPLLMLWRAEWGQAGWAVQASSAGDPSLPHLGGRWFVVALPH